MSASIPRAGRTKGITRPYPPTGPASCFDPLNVDPESLWNLFLYKASFPIQVVTANSGGQPQNDGCHNVTKHSISADGRYVAFTSNATNLGASGGGNVFVHDRQTGVTAAITDNPNNDSAATPAISGDGRFVVFRSTLAWDARYDGGGLFVYDSRAANNRPPVAKTGPDQTVSAGAKAILDGGGSYDPDGGPQPLSFAWSLKSGPQAVALSDSHAARPAFSPTQAGVYVFSLTVSDGQDSSASALATVTVKNGNGGDPGVSGDVGIGVDSPAEGDEWLAGDELEIDWTYSGFDGAKKLKIYYSKNGGASYAVLKSGIVADTGYYRFKLTGKQASEAAAVKVCLPKTARTPEVCGTKRGVFGAPAVTDAAPTMAWRRSQGARGRGQSFADARSKARERRFPVDPAAFPAIRNADISRRFAVRNVQFCLLLSISSPAAQAVGANPFH